MSDNLVAKNEEIENIEILINRINQIKNNDLKLPFDMQVQLTQALITKILKFNKIENEGITYTLTRLLGDALLNTGIKDKTISEKGFSFKGKDENNNIIFILSTEGRGLTITIDRNLIQVKKNEDNTISITGHNKQNASIEIEFDDKCLETKRQIVLKLNRH